jgi:hypothetical protein
MTTVLNTDLTDLEAAMLPMLIGSSEGNGHDFGFHDEVMAEFVAVFPKKNIHVASALVGSFKKKGWIDCYETDVCDGGYRRVGRRLVPKTRVVWQFVFTGAARVHLGLGDE